MPDDDILVEEGGARLGAIACFVIESVCEPASQNVQYGMAERYDVQTKRTDSCPRDILS